MKMGWWKCSDRHVDMVVLDAEWPMTEITIPVLRTGSRAHWDG
jgi:hypothetical protein